MHSKKNFIEGKTALLQEVCPKFFSYIISWRNNPILNRYINQPFILTEEIEKKWYNNYLKDNTQGLMIIIDKETNIPIGTHGWKNYDAYRKICTGERLMLGDQNFRYSSAFYESFILMYDFLYTFVDIMYCHISCNNESSIHINELFGYRINKKIVFPHYLAINNMKQYEFYRTKNMYFEAKYKLKHILPTYLRNEIF